MQRYDFITYIIIIDMLVFLETGAFLDINQGKCIKSSKKNHLLGLMIASPEHKDIFNRKHGKDYPRREYYFFTQKARKSQKSFPITHWTVSAISAGLKAQHRIFL